MISGRCLPICSPSLQCDIKRVWSILFGGFLCSVVYILYNIYLIISGAMNLRITRTTSFGSITQGLKNQERIALACIFHGSKKVPAPWRVFWLQEEHDYTFSILSPSSLQMVAGRITHSELDKQWHKNDVRMSSHLKTLEILEQVPRLNELSGEISIWVWGRLPRYIDYIWLHRHIAA